MPETVGTIAQLGRFPVKSMLGEQPDSVDVTEAGVVGDRAYALIDPETGKVLSAKEPRKWPQLLHCRASYVAPPTAGQPAPPVRITLADGTEVMSDAADVDDTLSLFFGRKVSLATAAPDAFVVDHYQPDLEPEAIFPGTEPDTVNDQAVGSSLWAEIGMPSAVPPGSLLDMFPMSVLTTSTLRTLTEATPGSDFDPRRFRMNLVVDTTEPGFLENGWIGQPVQAGGCSLTVMLPDPRCVMTTAAQDGLPKDNAILQTLARRNRLDVAGAGMFPCAGVYAVVTSPGTIRVGDEVTVG